MPAWQAELCDYRIFARKNKKRFRSLYNRFYYLFRAFPLRANSVNCNVRNLMYNGCKISYVNFSRSLNPILVLTIKQIFINSVNGYRKTYNHSCERELRINNIAYDRVHALVSWDSMDFKIGIFLSMAAYNSCFFWKPVLDDVGNL